MAKKRESSVSSSHQRGKKTKEVTPLGTTLCSTHTHRQNPSAQHALPTSCPGWETIRALFWDPYTQHQTTAQQKQRFRGRESCPEGRTALEAPAVVGRGRQAQWHTPKWPNPAHTAPHPTLGHRTPPRLGTFSAADSGVSGDVVSAPSSKTWIWKRVKECECQNPTWSRHPELQQAARFRSRFVSELRSWNAGSQQRLRGSTMKAASSAVKVGAQTHLSWKDE